jgi:hypothetical protein
VTKNCILVAGASDNWDEGDIWRLTAEQAYNTSFLLAEQIKDENSLDVLRGLRAELDQLEEFMREDMAEEMYGHDEAGVKDDAALAEAENQDEVAAHGMMDLVIRSASEKTNPTCEAPTPTFSIVPPTEGSTPSSSTPSGSESRKLRR